MLRLAVEYTGTRYLKCIHAPEGARTRVLFMLTIIKRKDTCFIRWLDSEHSSCEIREGKVIIL